jgi:pilus assembly protein CpaF
VGFLSVLRGTDRRTQLPFCAAGSLERAIERLCVHEGVPLHPSEQLAQRVLPSWSFQLDLVRGPTAPNGPIVRLRRREPVAVNLEDLVRGGAVSRHLANFLQQCVVGRANILVVGSQRSGAEELLSALALATEGERVLMLTDFEVPSTVDGRTMALSESPGVRLDQVLSRLADVGGHRLVIDGLNQGSRALGTLRALFEGADGVIARLASRSIERGVAQLCSQIALNTPGLGANSVAEGIIAAFDLAIEVGRLRDGRSRVLRVAELARAPDGNILANDVFTFVVDRIASGGTVEGSFNPTGRRPHFALALKTRGVRLDSGIFGRAARTTSPDQK